jgi:hypothetical protein
MKFLPVVLVLGCAGCASPKLLPLPQPSAEPRALVTVPAVDRPVLPPVPAAAEAKLRQQTQLIEALLSQNDALRAQANAAAVPPAGPAVPATLAAPPAAPAAPMAAPVPESFLMPNAEGVIDLAAVGTAGAEGPVNPFAVRTAAADPHEIVLHLQGIVAGEPPCALVNDRLLGIGEAVETLTLTRIGTDALYFQSGNFSLKVPVTGQPAKIRGAL